MKIGLITIVNGASFGNRLQNYAMQRVFERLGYEIETINNRYEKNSKFKTYCQYFLAKSLGWLPWMKGKARNWKRMYTFYRWDCQYIRYARLAVNAKTYRESRYHLAKRYDYFVVGSDQVWNPRYAANRGFELLSFVPPPKRVSLSTSIGCDRIPDAFFSMYQKEWRRFKAISVRENEAADLIQKASGEKAAVHIDPTMMLSKEEWKGFQKKPASVPQKKYLLAFFLSDVDEKTVEILTTFAREKTMTFLNLDFRMLGYEKVSPSEFVYFISHARMVCTDSFHASVFSLLFGRALAVCKRFDGDEDTSRLKTLLEKTGQEQFWLDRIGSVEDLKKRYERFHYELSGLREERQAVVEYIKKVCSS